jgi:cation transport ATPase
VLSLAAALESHTRHPLADAIMAEALTRQLAVPDGAEVVTEPGQGVMGTVCGVKVAVGRRDWVERSVGR